jgi:hypothetical protein
VPSYGFSAILCPDQLSLASLSFLGHPSNNLKAISGLCGEYTVVLHRLGHPLDRPIPQPSFDFFCCRYRHVGLMCTDHVDHRQYSTEQVAVAGILNEFESYRPSMTNDLGPVLLRQGL